jgi:hypothetical protein
MYPSFNEFLALIARGITNLSLTDFFNKCRIYLVSVKATQIPRGILTYPNLYLVRAVITRDTFTI